MLYLARGSVKCRRLRVLARGRDMLYLPVYELWQLGSIWSCVSVLGLR